MVPLPEKQRRGSVKVAPEKAPEVPKKDVSVVSPSSTVAETPELEEKDVEAHADAPPIDEVKDAGSPVPRTRRRSHFVPSGASGAEAVEAVEAVPPEQAGALAAVVVDDPRGAFQGSHDACLLGVTKTVRGSTPLVEAEFKEKYVEQSGCASESEARTQFSKAGVAISCAKGRKPGTPNQDNFFVAQCGPFLLCCVADGHGTAGHWVSHWTCKFVLRMLLQRMEGVKTLPKRSALNEIFDTAHQEVICTANSEKFEVALSGTTLSVAIIDRPNRKVMLAWAGDSRMVLGRPARKGVLSRLATGPSGKAEYVGGLADHKPNDPKEKQRIEQNGGQVLLLPGDVPYRVFAKGKEIPGLAMSRSVGDLAGHMAGVIHEPSVEVLDFQKDDLLLCCSDGVWEFLSNGDALNIVAQAGRKKAAEAVLKLSAESRKQWLAEAEDCCDDITVIAVWLS